MKAIQYIEDESFVVVNPDYPVISKENALKAVEIAESELKEKVIEVYKRNCRLYQPTCLEGDNRPCTGRCEYLADFITELNK